ncbi:hypothetical protein OJF2_74380 [Aquisphaera giovannonii]|uniref:DUF2254 domain-containing protein n=1 Tax=Aquisphaera giovannonii TaxID=406548 RepID=A0A5B9WDT2_9BACT|nr:DUF2254 domain-containing protein [Aquisphaera giovannonii]QEH38828.1 hypothetical protein OJF2_74380 [Aquisphaera giovannonii]
MRLWLESKWEGLRTSFWFVPTLMVTAAIALSLATIHLDRTFPEHNWIATLGWTYTRGPEGSRAVLSAVAGSMMTIASVTLSITVVALQLASSQFGPRLLRNFMGDRGSQVALGTFIATFAYCLLVLRAVNGQEGEQFVPHIAVTVGLLLSLASLGVLIYFIHHTAEAIQAENVIDSVSRELRRAIDRLYPECLGREADETSSPPGGPRPPEGFDRDSRPIPAPAGGYLQAIDVDRLMGLARQHDVILDVRRRPGKFVVEGSELVRAWPADRADDGLAEALGGAFYFGHRRTLRQDVEFAVDQLVEIAVRALSPGINDPFTAMNCVDRLGEALCTLAGRDMPSPYRYDDEGRLRVVADVSTAAGIVDASFHQIRQAARGDAAVTMRLLEAIAEVARAARAPDFRAALRRQADAIRRGGREGLADVIDRQELDRRHREAMQALGIEGEGAPTRPDAQDFAGR